MRYFYVLLVLPTLALAQAPEGQVQPQSQPPTFAEFKQQMQPVIEHSLPAMHKMRECVSKANSKQATEACMQIMAENIQALQKKMGAPAGAQSQGMPPMDKFPEGFEWNDQVKQKMLRNMDRAIVQNTAMQECLQNSNTKEEMGNCMRSKMPAPASQ
jgi:hypothetical protein